MQPALQLCFLEVPIRGAQTFLREISWNCAVRPCQSTKGTQWAIPHQGARTLNRRVWFLFARLKLTSKLNGRGSRPTGELVMDLSVQIKICEGCGCLWYRAQYHTRVHCFGCETRLKDFPTPESRKRRGRPARKAIVKGWAMAETVGGAL
jgi:hypothetical protein